MWKLGFFQVKAGNFSFPAAATPIAVSGDWRYVMIWLQNLSGKALKVGVEILLQCIIEAEAKKSHVESLLLRSHGTLKKPFYVCNLGGHDGAAVASERDKKEKSAIMTEVFGKKCIIWSQTRKKVSPFVSSQKLKRNLFLGTKVPRELDPIINSSFIIDFMKNWCRKNAGKKCNFVRQK